MNWKQILLIALIVILVFLVGVTVYLLIFVKKPTPTPVSKATFPTQQTTIPVVTQTNTTPATQTQTPAAPTPPTDPSALLAYNFYKWYVSNSLNNSRFEYTNEFTSEIGNWLTPSFISQWKTIIANTEEDPVLLSQDYDSSWDSQILTKVQQETATSSTVLITLGLGSQQQQVLAHLVAATSSEWRIAAVTNP